MAEIAKLKNKRSICRTKTTKAIKNALKFCSDNLAAIKPRELGAKIEVVKADMEAHQLAHQALIDQMRTERKSEDEIHGEEDGQEAVEATYDGELEKLEEGLVLSNLYLADLDVQRDAASWLRESAIESPTFVTDGNRLKQELRTLVKDLSPYAAHPYIGGQLKKAQTMLEQLSVKLFATPAPSKEAAPVPKPTAPRSMPPPYQIKPPTFNGNPKEFHHFCERFEAIMELHKDFYPEADKISILADAMEDAESKKLVLNACCGGYDEALEQLKLTYGRKTIIYPYLVEELVKKERYDCSRESMRMILDRAKRVLTDMDKMGGRNIDLLAVALVVKDFDTELQTEWSKHLGSEDELPSLKKLVDFVTPLAHNLPRKTRSTGNYKSYQKFSTVPTPQAAALQPAAQGAKKQPDSPKKEEKLIKKMCVVCKETVHPLHRCKKFKESTTAQKWSVVSKYKMCSNCLHPSHQVADCTSRYLCRVCGEKHNILLHKDEDKKPSATDLVSAGKSDTSNKPPEEKAAEPTLGCGFIHTALVTVRHQGRKLTARAAMDSCATHSIMSEKVTSFLQPQRQPIDLIMRGTVSESKLKHWTTVTLSTVQPSEVDIPIGVAIAPTLPAASPPENPGQVAKHELLEGLPLADPEFGGQIDLIIGTNDLPLVWVDGDKRFSAEARMTAVNTIFGWTVSGPSKQQSGEVTTMKVEISEDIKLFNAMYELEQVPTASSMTDEEKSAVAQFEDTIRQESDGRYSCQLPKVSDPPQLGSSEKMAKSRFLSNERRMLRMGQLESFNAEMAGYLEMGHAEVVSDNKEKNAKYYLPVKGVVKTSSTSTKVRPVFDASAKSSNGKALNDIYLVGPNLYPLILDILLKFRVKPVAIAADISKMYREVWLQDEDKDYHRLFIRAKNGELLQARMKRLTFGVRPSPFVATSVIRHHAKLNATQYPEASEAILANFYVDDYLASVDTVEEADKLRESLCQLLNLCGMTLRKWRASSDNVLEKIPPDLLEKEDRKELMKSDALKTLGVHWDTKMDSFFVATPSLNEGVVTKRGVARGVAKVYDVLGLVSPFVILGKLLLQELWLRNVSWDNDIPLDLAQAWHDWVKQLITIKEHSIDRYIGLNTKPVKEVSLHGFADSSTKAYGAAIYIRVVHEDKTVATSLLCSKARVSPLKTRSLPEMELVAAKMAADLLAHVAMVLKIPLKDVNAWTDSMIVLSWLEKPLFKLKVFVSNRVAQIREKLPEVQWRHVNSSDNPADLPSRGVSANSLVESHIWWHGPKWLSSGAWPKQPGNIDHDSDSVLRGMKATVMVAIATSPFDMDWEVWHKFSSYIKLCRVIAWALRFGRCCRKKNVLPPQLVLTADDIKAAEAALITVQQQVSFPEVFQALENNKLLPKGHSLGGLVVSLKPTNAKLKVDSHSSNTLVAKGRVNERELIPLSGKNKLTRLMLLTQHKLHSHAGVSALISIIGYKFYIVGIKKQLKLISRQCASCLRTNAVPLQQQLGYLPAARTVLAPPFQTCGIDFAGPITLREGAVRKPVLIKSYLCLFVCMSTRAIHIEVCKNLSTEDFIAALRRFANKRGMPASIYSDNGSNFIGAKAELDKIQSMLNKSQHKLSLVSSETGLKWHFSPPRAPHFGGLWEAGVKSMKRQIKKIVQPHPLRLDEILNVVSEVEAILNSRPLAPLDSVEVEEGLVLTPGHFLVFRPLKAPPTPVASTAKLAYLRRWQLTQRLVQELETAWKGNYLQSLQARSKWTRKRNNVKVNDIVFIKDITLSNGARWPLGRITKVYPGRDGLVRTVDLLYKRKSYKRAIHLLIPLHLDEEQAKNEEEKSSENN